LAVASPWIIVGEEVRAVKHTALWTPLALTVLALGYLGIRLFVATRLTVPD
jgi:hypothetical protein